MVRCEVDRRRPSKLSVIDAYGRVGRVASYFLPSYRHFVPLLPSIIHYSTMMCALRVSVYLVLSTAFHSESFQLASPKLRRSAVAGETSIAATNDGNNHDPDLFDYFDPLLSPHAYPKGISPEHKPDQTFKEHAEDQQQFPVASDMIAAITKDDPDHFDYFDPLLSPPAYPNGVSSNYRPDQNYKNPDDDSERYNPLRLNIANLGGSPSPPPTRPKIDPLFLFDPTLSPHMYPKGTPSNVIGDESTSFVDSVVPSTNQFPPRRIGILLMDHGSRNKESNERLHELARLYQKSVDAHVIVQAAHMEIATPSIPEGLASLAKAGVGT